MRRKVFEANSEELFLEILRGAPIGQLGLVDGDGFPRIIPVNFAYGRGAIYFHETRQQLAIRPRKGACGCC